MDKYIYIGDGEYLSLEAIQGFKLLNNGTIIFLAGGVQRTIRGNLKDMIEAKENN